jgi:WS/DGAT/MGAT family acyltransferase
VFVHDPVWVDDRGFDVRNHVGRIRHKQPSEPAEIRALAGELLSQPLDRRRPLWRLHLVDGLQDGGFAVIGQVHHALVDGISAVEVAKLLLDPRPQRGVASPRPWAPAREPSLATRALDTLGKRFRLARSMGSLALRTVTNPAVVADALDALSQIGAALESAASPAPATAINKRIGKQRSVAFAQVPLAAAQQLGRQTGTTVNDVVLATASLALGRYLRRTGECHPWLRAVVPVSTRPADTASKLGNKLSFLLVELPVGERVPAAVLQEVCRQMGEHKRAETATALDGLLQAARFAPLPLRDALAMVATRPQTFNLVVSNVPGPCEPLYLLGRPVRAAYPSVPLAQGHALSIGVLSYRDSLHVGLYADPTVMPDLVGVAQDFTSAFHAMRFSMQPRRPRPPRPDRGGPVPGRTRELTGLPH